MLLKEQFLRRFFSSSFSTWLCFYKSNVLNRCAHGYLSKAYPLTGCKSAANKPEVFGNLDKNIFLVKTFMRDFTGKTRKLFTLKYKNFCQWKNCVFPTRQLQYLCMIDTVILGNIFPFDFFPSSPFSHSGLLYPE